MENKPEIFISFKNLDAEGLQTRDSFIAAEVYNFLTGHGINTFFSNISLEKLGVSAYQKYIDEVLDSAKVLIVVGTTVNNIESPWVRYEWSSFFNDILSGAKPNSRIFCYVEGIKSSELPRSLRQSQVIQNEVGSLTHLYHFIANAIGRKTAQDIINANKIQLFTSIRQVMHNDIAVQIGSMVVFLSDNKKMVISQPTIRINETQIENMALISSKCTNGTFVFEAIDDTENLNKIITSIIEANLLLNPDLTGADLLNSIVARPEAAYCAGRWYEVLTGYGPAPYIDIRCKLCGYETDFTPSMHEGPPSECLCCGFGTR